MKQYWISIIKFFSIFYMALTPVILYGQSSNKQGIDLTKSFPSPEVAALGNFGLMPANPYNGQINVTIPLYNVSYKDLEIPISLMYSTGGHKIDDHPGWTGLGWTLKAGGVIYRKVNGSRDEYPKDFQLTYETCYLYNCGRVQQSYNNIDSIVKYAFVNLQAGEEVKFYYDAEPDEFIFNFNGYSGVFYFTRPFHEGPLELKVRSNGDYRLKAELLEIKDHLDFDDWLWGTGIQKRNVDRTIYKLKITDEKGIQYIFGGTPNSIEFSNNGNLGSSGYTIANAWYLTEVIAPAGYKTILDYKRVGRTYVQQKQRNIYFHSSDASLIGNGPLFFGIRDESLVGLGSYENIVISVHNPVYLKSITTPAQTIYFSSSKSNELDYPYDEQTFNRLLQNSQDGEWAKIRNWQKLDEINIAGVKKIRFNYLEQTDRRLQLSNIELRTKLDVITQQYSFLYNAMQLPTYNSKMADHWGYYNGRSYGYNNDYPVTREPVAEYLQAEMLTKITYPTGGYLELEYEPHYYNKIARQFPFIVETTSTQKLAGGLRIKKQIARADANSEEVIKEFFYEKDYINGGTNSSGILSGEPIYVNEGNAAGGFCTGNIFNGGCVSGSIYYAKVVDNNFLQLSSTNGNHITYTEVTEKTGAGYQVYKYSNHDNGYHDTLPLLVFTNFSNRWREDGFTSMESFRGLLLSSEVYNGNKQLLKESKYEYDINIANSDYLIPRMYRYYDESMGYNLTRVSSGVYYTKPPLVKKVTETEYIPASGTLLTSTRLNHYFPEIYTTALSRYDNYKVAESILTNSKGEELKNIYWYPYSKLLNAQDAGAIYGGMINSNMNAVLLREAQLKNGDSIRLLNTEYYQPYTDLFVPYYIQVQQGNAPLETETYFNRYDQTGNIQEISKKGGVQVSYIWNYQYQYPVAEVQNAVNSNIAYTSFEGDGKGNWEFSDSMAIYADCPGGIKCYQLSQVNDYRLSKSSLSNEKTYIVSYWSRNGKYNVSGSVSWYSGKEVNGWQYYEHKVTGITSVTITGTGNIDEVRLHPEGATMTTYVYDPLIGMTSQCDINNRFTYYEYDSFGRLHVIRNQEKNIIKTICYDYTGQQSICNEKFYNNTEQRRAFTKICEGGREGSTEVYVVKDGKHGSTISVEDANQKALADIEENGQAYANQMGTCLFYNDLKSLPYTRDNCTSGYVGTEVTYTVPAYTYTSEISKADANNKAMQEMYANGQNNADSLGNCVPCNVFFTQKADSDELGGYLVTIKNTATGEVLFTRSFGGTFNELPICYALPSGTPCTVEMSSMSTLYATINGVEKQTISNATQTWNTSFPVSIEMSTRARIVYLNGPFNIGAQKNDCGTGYVGSSVSYPVPGGVATSYISVGDANSKAAEMYRAAALVTLANDAYRLEIVSMTPVKASVNGGAERNVQNVAQVWNVSGPPLVIEVWGVNP